MSTPSQPPRTPLTRERVLHGALAVADADGLAALTIRALASHLGVKPMAIYHHVAGKEAILDGVVDLVFGEIELPVPGQPWRAEIRRRACSARDVLSRHPWALAVLETRREPGPATLAHHEAVLGTLRSGGLSLDLTAQAYAMLDSYVYGFVLQEVTLPVDGAEEYHAAAQELLAGFRKDLYPHLHEFATQHVMRPGYTFGTEFDRGLDLVLDGLERLHERDGGGQPAAPAAQDQPKG